MEALAKNWGWFVGLGALMVVLGLIAIAAPAVATLAVGIMVGWLLMIGGIAQIVQAFGSGRWRGFFLHLLGGVLYLAVGALIVFDPLGGAIALTILFAAFLVVQGVFQIIFAWQLRPLRTWGWAMVNGILSLVLGVLIWMEWPSSALWVLGLLVGIHLVFSGWALIMIGFAVRRHASEPPVAGADQHA
jgi:uncharacterized membrane protein HdeD (DUF308 family)